MHIFLIHNYYMQTGGEDRLFHAEKSLLQRKGQAVSWYVRHNNEISTYSFISKLCLAKQTIWANQSIVAVLHKLKEQKPDIVHVHNTFPLISPASYYACHDLNLPVVQTLHNYRLLCPAATFYRDGHVCEECLKETVPYSGVLHACYRRSRLQTTVVTMMLLFHRLLRTWQKQVDIYIVLTDFARKKFIEAGLPAEKIVVKSNFVQFDPGVRGESGKYAVFVGRLSSEKGVMTLLKAWRHTRQIPLSIVGGGPLLEKVRSFIRTERQERLQVLGTRDHKQVIKIMKGARFLVFPSECYENFPMVIAEAFACGVPVIASKLGAIAEIVEDGRTGLHFAPGSPDDLAEKVESAWLNERKLQEMGKEARKDFEKKYTAASNYEKLIGVYERLLESRRA